MSSTLNPTRDRILKSTVNLLETGGASAVRMADIAKAAKISRQALYLHFPNRAELLVATTHYLDEINDIERQLVESRSAASGTARLAAWIAFWGNYIPKIFGIGKALMVLSDSDEDAAAAWDERMEAVRDGCRAAIASLAKDGILTQSMTQKEATDALWSLLSVRVWEQLRQDCGWSQDRYIHLMQQMATDLFVATERAEPDP